MKGKPQSWLLESIGASPAAGADAATWQLDSNWSWAPWLTLLLVLAAIAWTVQLYAREATSAGRGYRALLTVLRLGALGIALIMIAQWVLTIRLTGPPTVALIIDRSASMGIADRYDKSALSARISERLSENRLPEPTRLNLAKLLLTQRDQELLRELSTRYRLAMYFAAEGVERESNSASTYQRADSIRELSSNGPDSQASRLGDAVRQVLDDFRTSPPAAMILLSDGVTTAGVPLAGAAQQARQVGVPLFTIGLGRDQSPRDVEIADVLVDDAVFVDDLVNFQVQIKATGLEGEAATVTLRKAAAENGASADRGTVLAEQSIVLPPSGETLTTFVVDRPTQPGQFAYVVEIAPRDDESNGQNNSQRRVVAVRDEKIRVLLAQSYPSYEFRFLKMLLERDRTIQLATYLQDADPEYAAQDKSALRAFPLSRAELFEYDVLVIGDLDPRSLPRSTWQNVRDFAAEKGGGVAVLSGPKFMPWLYQDIAEITALLPIDADTLDLTGSQQLPDAVTRGFVVRPTPVGLQSPTMQLGDTPEETARIWQTLAPLYWMFEAQGLKPAAQVLAEHPTLTGPAGRHLPVICFQFVGPGRVLFHAIDSTWRWRLGAGDVYFARYWVQTIRFLARGKLTSGAGVELSADRREYRHGEVVRLRARFRDPRAAPAGAEINVLVESPGQPRRRVALHRNSSLPGVFEGSLADLAQGQYEVVVAEPQSSGNPPATRFTVVAPPGELARLEMDAAALSYAAEISRGKFYTFANADELLNDLPTGRRVPLASLPPIPLWNRWWLLTAFLACITSEWILRKRKGML
jgi:hypothetical protein